ncbi:MAG: hypothetical protein IE916_00470 [Epsilonproteobacteria bacterium]|nr:hypothetical protein [Campylobacterota bacterium]
MRYIITNDIEEVSKDLDIDKIIYKDSMDLWSYWSRETSYRSLAKNGEEPKELEIAIEVAKMRFLPLKL